MNFCFKSLLSAFPFSNMYVLTEWASIVETSSPVHVFLPSLCSYGWLHFKSRAGQAVCLSPVPAPAKHLQHVACQPVDTGLQEWSEEQHVRTLGLITSFGHIIWWPCTDPSQFLLPWSWEKFTWIWRHCCWQWWCSNGVSN